MIETVRENQRVYLIFEPGDAGRTVLRLSLEPPSLAGGALAALIVRGLIMDGAVMDVDLVTDPKLDPDLTGPTGPNGWTPILAFEQDGTRTLLKVADWARSTGKPLTGYLTATGALAATKAEGSNFNATKRVLGFSGVSDATGIAAISFGSTFAGSAAAPQVVSIGAVPNLPVGGIKAEIVVGSVTRAGCQVRITGAQLLSSVVTPLSGATANVLAIEA